MMVRGAEAPFELGGATVRMVAFIHTHWHRSLHSKPQVRLAWKLPPTATGRLALVHCAHRGNHGYVAESYIEAHQPQFLNQ